MVIKLFDRHSVLVCACILAAAVAVITAVNFSRSGASGSVPAQGRNSFSVSASAAGLTPASASGSGASAPAVSAAKASSSEMRAVWVPYMSLDMSREKDKSEKAFQAKFSNMIAVAKKYGMNTLVVQVRPFGDALYPSAYFPWSSIVGGTQGVNPGYDPLKDMVSAAHRAEMKIQAWVNPLRIQVNGTPSILAQGNLYNKWKSDSAKKGYVVDTAQGKYYNPAYGEVRRLIADGVREIAKNYEVDGIQFDDYFYPTQDASFDKAAYDAYCGAVSKNGKPLGLQEWRQANINALVALVYSGVKSVKKNLPFGIAPQGNVENDLKMGADVAAWCNTRGYVDFICPQLYVNFDNPVLPFGTAAQAWRKLVTNSDIKLYFGLAVYKAGSDADSGTWKKSGSILAQQVEAGRKNSCDGFMFYSWDSFNSSQAKEEIQNVMKVLK